MSQNEIIQRHYTVYKSNLHFGSLKVSKHGLDYALRGMEVIGEAREYLHSYFSGLFSHRSDIGDFHEAEANSLFKFLKQYPGRRIGSRFGLLFTLFVLVKFLDVASPVLVSLLPKNRRNAWLYAGKYRILLILLRAKKLVRPKQLEILYNPGSKRGMFRNLKGLNSRRLVTRKSPCHRKAGYQLSRQGFEVAFLLDELSEYRKGFYANLGVFVENSRLRPDEFKGLIKMIIEEIHMH